MRIMIIPSCEFYEKSQEDPDIVKLKNIYGYCSNVRKWGKKGINVTVSVCSGCANNKNKYKNLFKTTVFERILNK